MVVLITSNYSCLFYSLYKIDSFYHYCFGKIILCSKIGIRGDEICGYSSIFSKKYQALYLIYKCQINNIKDLKL